MKNNCSFSLPVINFFFWVLKYQLSCPTKLEKYLFIMENFERSKLEEGGGGTQTEVQRKERCEK